MMGPFAPLGSGEPGGSHTLSAQLVRSRLSKIIQARLYQQVLYVLTMLNQYQSNHHIITYVINKAARKSRNYGGREYRDFMYSFILTSNQIKSNFICSYILAENK